MPGGLNRNFLAIDITACAQYLVEGDFGHLQLLYMITLQRTIRYRSPQAHIDDFLVRYVSWKLRLMEQAGHCRYRHGKADTDNDVQNYCH